MRRLALVALALLLLAPAAAAEEAEEDERFYQLLPLISIVITLILGGIGIISFIRGLNIQRKHAAIFSDFAMANNLKITGTDEPYPDPAVEGDYRHRHIRLDTYSVIRSIKMNIRYTRLRLTLDPPFDGHLELRHEGLIAKLDKLFGREDIELHDSEFDPHYIVRCSDPALPERMLEPHTRERLLRFRKYRFTWAGAEAKAERVGKESDAERLQALLEILSDVADELERYAGRRP